jgi:cytoskeleton protein RodZ
LDFREGTEAASTMDERRQQNSPRSSGSAAESPAPDAGARPARDQGSFGAWLRTQREARGVTMQAIVDASKISQRYLEALESDRFDVLPAPVFVRGFLREYARVVGLDGDEVVNFYLLAQPARSVERAGEGRAAPARSERSPARHGALIGYGVLLAALLAVFVGVAAAISWWAGRRAERSPPAASTAAPVPAIAAPSAPALEETSAPAPPDAAVGPAGEVPRLDSTPEAPPAAAPPASDGRLHVVLEFQQDCWVEVVVDGRRRESELKAGGETLALEADDYVALTLGNAPAVRVELNGRPFPLATQGSRVVRELRIDRSALAAPGAPPTDAAPRP